MSITSEDINNSNLLAEKANEYQDAKNIKDMFGGIAPEHIKNALILDRELLSETIETLKRVLDRFPKRNEEDYDRFLVILNSDASPITEVGEVTKNEIVGVLSGEYVDSFMARKEQEYNDVLAEINS